MKYWLCFISALLTASSVMADWKPVEDAMMSEWDKKITPENVWTEYPRPQLVRQDWTSLTHL